MRRIWAIRPPVCAVRWPSLVRGADAERNHTVSQFDIIERDKCQKPKKLESESSPRRRGDLSYLFPKSFSQSHRSALLNSSGSRKAGQFLRIHSLRLILKRLQTITASP